MATAHDLSDYWNANYPECEPIPHLLRDAYRKRWVRFHTLPESKRYPEDEAELQVILHRHNTLLAKLAYPKEELVLVTASYSSLSDQVEHESDREELIPTALPWRTVPTDDGIDASFPMFFQVEMCSWLWLPGTFDPILRLIANAAEGNIMMLSIANHWVYHPYDGGADVILSSQEKRHSLRARFKEWASPNASGL